MQPGWRWTKLSATVLGLLPLTACGGGGGGVVSTPAPASTPLQVNNPPPPLVTTVPPLTPNDPTFVTQEYRDSIGASNAYAVFAYEKGATGAGVTAAIVDSGLTETSGEFAGRVSPASANVGGGSGFDDQSGHGTEIASALAAARNGVGMHGIAYDATLLIMRADTPGSCLTSSGCVYQDANIAAGLDRAVAQRARVINLSLGGSAPTNVLRMAIDRATAAGSVIVISAGNDGAANPNAFAEIANDPIARGQIIVVGALTEDGSGPASITNRAGNAAQHVIMATGDNIRTPGANGVLHLVTGTSIATPLVSGAIALLAQAFPNLSAAQLVELLLTSATDIGAPGVDAVDGHGALNLTAAFAPKGALSLAGTTLALSPTVNAVLGAPMGDAAQGLTADTIIVDGFQRAFTIDFGRSFAVAPPVRTLANALIGDARQASFGDGGLQIGFAWQHQHGFGGAGPFSQISTTHQMSASFATAIGRTTSLSLGLARTGSALTDIGSAGSPAFLVARDPIGSGLQARPSIAVAVRHDHARFAFAISAEQGHVDGWRPASIARDPAYQAIETQVGWQKAGLRLSGGIGWLHEDATILGSRFAAGLAQGAQSLTASAGARLSFAQRWQIGVQARRGRTRARSGGVIGGGAFTASAFAIEISRSGVIAPGDRLAFRIAQPLRVDRGTLSLVLPTSYDYGSGIAATSLRSLNLSPKGRELDAEAGYAFGWRGGSLGLSGFARRDAGNIATMPLDLGGALRLRARW